MTAQFSTALKGHYWSIKLIWLPISHQTLNGPSNSTLNGKEKISVNVLSKNIFVETYVEFVISVKFRIKEVFSVYIKSI